jgi:hypothetical protein
VRDQWAVVGRRLTEDDRLRVQRTGFGAETRRGALLLHFAPAGTVRSETKPIDPTFVPGTAFDGTLVFFPSAAPLRAIAKERTAVVDWPSDLGYADISEAAAATTGADSRMPWLESQPVLLREATPTTLRRRT